VTAVLADRPVTCSAAMARWSTAFLADTRQKPSAGYSYDETAQIRWQTSARNREILAAETEPPRSAAYAWLRSNGTGHLCHGS
jgi:hypothetical protein